jgi:hypothetical protein
MYLPFRVPLTGPVPHGVRITGPAFVEDGGLKPKHFGFKTPFSTQSELIKATTYYSTKQRERQ